jgi:hypothetical protein
MNEDLPTPAKQQAVDRASVLEALQSRTKGRYDRSGHRLGSEFAFADSIQHVQQGAFLTDHGPGTRIQRSSSSIEMHEAEGEILFLEGTSPRSPDSENIPQFGSKVLQALEIGRKGIHNRLVGRAGDRAFPQVKKLQRHWGRFHDVRTESFVPKIHPNGKQNPLTY